MADTKDTIRTDIKVDAAAAIEQLRNMAKGAKNAEEAVAKYSDFLLRQSMKWNMSLERTRNLFQSINALLTKKTGEGIFGSSANFEKINQASKAYTDAAIASRRLTLDSNGAVKSLSGVGGAMNTSSQAANKFRHSIDLVRTALGTLAAVGIFQALGAISGFFRGMIENLRETELAVYNLINAERKLSNLGIGITPKELQEIIDGVQELVPILSKIDAEELVSRVASNVAPSLKLTREEIEKLTKAVALAYVQNKALGYSFDEIEKSFTDSVLTGKVSQGMNKYGVKIDDLIIKQHAVSMSLVESEEAFDSLNAEAQAHVQAIALIDYAYQEFSKNADSIPEYMETADSAFEKTRKVWSDLLTTLGVTFGPVIIELLRGVIDGLVRMNEWLEKNKGTMMEMVAVMTGMISGFNKVNEIIDTGAGGTPWDKFKAVVQAIHDGMQRAKEDAASLNNALDTPTAALEDLQSAADDLDMSKAKKELEDLLKTLEQLGERIEKAERDFQTKLTRFDADALEDRSRLIEDYNLNVAQELRQFALRRKELEDNYRKRELDDEAKFQEQLRQLREKFLYNLEDALRERDARQVLRLIDQYNMEKQALINENALKKKEDAERQRDELQDLKAQEQERLRVMAEEHALRLQRQDEDSALRRSRMLEDHAQEIADLKAQREEILKEAAAKIAEEYNLNAEGAKAIYDLLNKYYGGDGILQKLVAQGYQGMLNESVGFLSQLQQLIAHQQGLMAMSAAMGSWGSATDPRGTPRPVSGGTTGSSSSRSRGSTSGKQGFASGGQFIATRPQSINVGEGGMPEIVSVIPLSKLLGGSLGLNGSGGGGSNSSIEVAVTLSPDLEGRIISKAMDGVGDVVSKVNRSK